MASDADPQEQIENRQEAPSLGAAGPPVSAGSGRFRAAQPKVIGATMQGLAGVDFKKDVLTEFCQQAGKACPNK